MVIDLGETQFLGPAEDHWVVGGALCLDSTEKLAGLRYHLGQWLQIIEPAVSWR